MSRFNKILEALGNATEKEKILPGEEAEFQEYEPRNLLADAINPALEKVGKKNEIEYFPTDEGFGSGVITDNPMLQKTGRKNADGDEMLANDLFRVVHDVYGHVKPGSTFGKVGEEVAYQNHRQMFSPLAQKALATETRGQNSYVNFGPNAAHNKANPANTIFAEQKVGLLPDWAVNENAAKEIKEALPLTAFTGIANSADMDMKKSVLQDLIRKSDEDK